MQHYKSYTNIRTLFIRACHRSLSLLLGGYRSALGGAVAAAMYKTM